MLKGGLPKKYQGVAAGRRSAANKLTAAGAAGSSQQAAAGGGGGGGRRQARLGGCGGDDGDIDDLTEGLLQRGGLQGAAVVPERGAGGPLAAARRALSLANTPAELPCRDAEKARITKFVEDIIVKGEGGVGGVGARWKGSGRCGGLVGAARGMKQLHILLHYALGAAFLSSLYICTAQMRRAPA